MPRELYAHMCRDGHVQIGHNDSEGEMCPLCRALAALKELHRRAEAYCNLSRVNSQSLRDEAAHDLRNAIAVARDLIAKAEGAA